MNSLRNILGVGGNGGKKQPNRQPAAKPAGKAGGKKDPIQTTIGGKVTKPGNNKPAWKKTAAAATKAVTKPAKKPFRPPSDRSSGIITDSEPETSPIRPPHTQSDRSSSVSTDSKSLPHAPRKKTGKTVGVDLSEESEAESTPGKKSDHMNFSSAGDVFMDEDGAYGSDDDDDDDDVEQEIDSPEETYDYGQSDEDADSQAESHPSGIGSDQSAPETDDSGDVFEYGNSEGQLNSNVKVEAFLRNHRAALEENQDLQRDWHPDAIDAYDELRALGTKPILPMDIREELETCPPGLFGVNPDCTINYHLDHWHGKRTTMTYLLYSSLKSMSKMGIDMRGMLVSQLPRPRRTKPIKEFFKWCARDGGYAHRRVIPNIILESVMPGDPIHYGTERLKKRLARLAQRWRDHLALEPADPENGFEAVYSREPPVVWGILAFEQKIIFCMVNSAHDPDFPPSASPSPSPPPVQYTKTGKVKVVPKKERESLEAEREEREERGRTTIENWGKLQVMTTVDWRDSTMDVWNAFTVAILCVKARDYMMEWRGDWPLKEGRTSSDPNVDESDN